MGVYLLWGAWNLGIPMRFFQDERLNLTACRFGRFFKDQSFLVRLKKTPFLYPITDVHHLKSSSES
jgi:hypothetical protein